MTAKTLSLWGNGAVTLPKEWRDQYPTKHFIAEQTSKGLLIKPIMSDESGEDDDVEFWEKSDGSFGLHFPKGMDMKEILRRWDKAMKNIELMKAKKSTARIRKVKHG